MSRLLVFRNLDGKVVRVDVAKVQGVRPNRDNLDTAIIHFRSGRKLIVTDKYEIAKERIISNKRVEQEKAHAEFKKKVKNCGELSDKFLRTYLEIKGGL